MDRASKIFIDIQSHLLEDDKPSLYIEELSRSELFGSYPLVMLKELKKTDQSPKHHPEGNVWNHTMLVVDQAAKVKVQSSDPGAFMWAALLHDIGKPATTKIRKGRITSYDHDIAGAELTVKFLKEFTDHEIFIEKVAELVRWHMQILFVINNLPFADVKKMKSRTDIKEVALLGFCDRMGRLGANQAEETGNIEKFLLKVSDM
ncbi:multifunctional CCA protein [Ruminiclostridium hungatei]|uniref:Multifunctional CCA protein n=1 Tax=Ruminiclostridium hungatei TaxID=48256 RepID=A0A1V4SLI5_RUMHU|nr:HDIG domain-containing metalloprotein [Ruminiclostridium hungatei]OPX44091.1 multifunctional CCA protein [Ruminiclostridium hungatei]